MNVFKKSIIIFWTLWAITALWTDIVGGLSQLQILNAPWAPNLNYPFLSKSLEMYSVPSWLTALLFIGIIVWQAIGTTLFIWTCFALNKPYAFWIKRAQIAFIVFLWFWFAFFLADQLIMKFDLEANHMIQGNMMFLTFLSLYIFPNEKNI